MGRQLHFRKEEMKITKYLQILIISSLALGCAQKARGTGKESLQAGEEATKIPVSPSERKSVPEKAPKNAAEPPPKEKNEVSQLIQRYKSETPVKVKIRKRVQSPYLVKEKVSSGELKLGKGIFRLDLEKPDNSTMVLDGKNIWLETRLDPEMGGQVQVSKFAMNDTRRANAVFAILFDKRDIHDGFKLVRMTKGDGSLKTFEYEPKKPAADYKKIAISISPQKNQLVSFSYEDELENKVIYDFGKTEFKAKVKKWQLEYTPPKGVKPSEFN